MPNVRLALILVALVAIVSVADGAWLTLQRGEAAGVKRVIYMSAVEYKGGTSSEPFPDAEPPAGGGYVLKPPGTDGRWETSTYRWEPGTIVVNEGDEVELWIWGVNGAQHPSTVEGHVPEFNVTRGNLTILNFTADKEGMFRITCHAHQPSMEAQLVVLGAGTQLQTATPTPASSPTPTPAPAPAQLPTTGGEPGDGGGLSIFGALLLATIAGAALLSVTVARRLRR